MKSSNTELYTNPVRAAKIHEYAAAHSTALPRHIVDYHAQASAARSDSVMLTSEFQSQFHVLLARSIGAKKVLEIGAYVGYSAMVWSHAVGTDGIVTTLEYSPDFAGIAKGAFASRNIENVEVLVGNAADTLPQVNTTTPPYDLVFLDADKLGHRNYLDILLSRSKPGDINRLVRSGALIIVDNTLRCGDVVEFGQPNPNFASEQIWRRDVEAVRAFNDWCMGEKRLDTFLVPLWDGVSIVRLRD